MHFIYKTNFLNILGAAIKNHSIIPLITLMHTLSAKRTLLCSFLLLVASLTTSCSKDHDLISEYMITTPTEVSLEQKVTTKILRESPKQAKGEGEQKSNDLETVAK